MFGRRILVLVPHPDDETVGCAAAVGRAIAQGSRISALYLTTGVPDRDVVWPWRRKDHGASVARRRDEAARAAETLGIEPAGFADIPTRTLRLHLDEALESIRAAITHTGADTVWVPAYEGGHQDHDAANALASRLAGEATVFEFAEYNFAGRAVRSQEFPDPNGTETGLSLTPEEIASKRAVLAIYASEQANLRHIACARECFRPLAAYDYARPPHAGTLFYARFRWVPFRHPRVDFTDPGTVCQALSAFVGDAR